MRIKAYMHERKPIRELKTVVTGIRKETPNTATIELFAGNDRLKYKPGHFLTIDHHQFHPLSNWILFTETMRGKREPPRAYSLVPVRVLMGEG